MKNLYPGVNPHLNSRLQSPNGGWLSFHNSLMVRMGDILDLLLPPEYLTLLEYSLQVQQVSKERRKSFEIARGIYVSIAQSPEDTNRSRNTETVVQSTSTFPMSANFEEEYPREMGVVIYKISDTESVAQPVTYIEMLSPDVKSGGVYHASYRFNRCDTLEAGFRLVELDLLHETSPIISAISDYSARESDSYPYSVLVSDPRPKISDGVIEMYGFTVGDALPTIRVPLDGDDWIALNLNTVYQTTFEQRIFYSILTDYTTRPLRFETYSAADQAFILRRMAEILVEKSSEETD